MHIKLLLLLFISSCNALVLEDYLPSDTRYDTSTPTPRAVTGLEVGERHYRHDQIIHYLNVIAASSERAKLIDYGVTNEGRRLVLLFISSPKNIEKLSSLATNSDILKVWNGFSVHGNETSGANASVLYAYHLIAGHSEELDKILNETLIIIDPTINPDGYDRYVNDVNAMRGMIDNPDGNDRSHLEQSPNGRTNHYWFDLNRDWLLLSQVESQARIKQFQHWQPHVLDDHHEMGSNKSFFFQPGVPERTNPLIPQKNIELTNKLGIFHAKALAEKGASFYTQESYDDFYPGKGSTYPDLHGSVGILFEQASARGGKLKTKEGMRELTRGIDNQFKTALSTLIGAFQLKSELLKYKQDFFKNALKESRRQTFKGYLFDFKNDLIKQQKMVDFLSLHQIKTAQLQSDLTLKSHKFEAQSSLFLSIEQKQYTLIKSLFNTDTQFKDNTFYDVSAWNLAMAWGLNYEKISFIPKTQNIEWQKPRNSYNTKAIAHIFNWYDGNAAAALNYLQQQKIQTRISSKPFVLTVNNKSKTFKAGAIIVPANSDEKENKKITTALTNISDFFQIPTHAITTGLTIIGIDLGSPSITNLTTPKVLLLMGENINSYQAGSIWHLFDTQVGLPLTKIKKSQLKNIDLHDYTHIILPSGKYSTLSEKTDEKIINWIKQGGQIIALQKANKWVEQKIQKITASAKTEQEKPQTVESKAYQDFESDNAKSIIGGAIISANVDLTHPLSYGTQLKTQYALLKGNSQLSASKNAYSTPMQISKNPLAAGYMSAEKQKQFSEKPLVIAEKLGKGTIIKFGFNPTFRGYWLGTQKWLINAVFLSSLIHKTELAK